MVNNKELSNNKKHEQEYEFVGVDFATGDQFKKIATLRSEDGSITFEQARKFYEEAQREAIEWWKNHPGESVTIREIGSEDGGKKQIIETVPKNGLICSSGFRSRIYDKNGKQIVGEKNIRKEIERRQEQWDQWKKEGKLGRINHEVHHTNDGSTVSVFTEVPLDDAEKLHPNEINDGSTWVPITGGKLGIESGEESQQTDENKISEEISKNEEHADGSVATGSSKEKKNSESIQKENKTDEGSDKKENFQEENDEGRKMVEKIKRNQNEWSVKKLIFALSNGTKGKRDCLVHSSAKIHISELGTSIYPVEIFTDIERKELSEVLNDSFLVNFLSSGKIEQDSLNKDNYLSVSLPNSSTSDNTQQTDKGKNTLIVFGVVFVLLVAGLAIAKSRFSKNKKK